MSQFPKDTAYQPQLPADAASPPAFAGAQSDIARAPPPKVVPNRPGVFVPVSPSPQGLATARPRVMRYGSRVPPPPPRGGLRAGPRPSRRCPRAGHTHRGQAEGSSARPTEEAEPGRELPAAAMVGGESGGAEEQAASLPLGESAGGERGRRLPDGGTSPGSADPAGRPGPGFG